MSNIYNFGVAGIGSNVKLGKNGPRIKVNTTSIEHRNAADNGYATVRGADPVSYDDLVTKRYLETRSNSTVTGQIDGNSPPAVVNGAMYICTTTGGTYTAEKLYYGEGGSWVEVATTPEGMTITTAVALTGGTFEFEADTRYVWDTQGASWVKIGPAPAETKLIKTARASLAFGTATPLNIGTPLPTNARVNKIIVEVTQAFNGTSPTVSFGVAGQTSELGLASESDLGIVGIYVIDTAKTYSLNEQLIATYVADGSTAGAATIEVFYSLA